MNIIKYKQQEQHAHDKHSTTVIKLIMSLTHLKQEPLKPGELICMIICCMKRWLPANYYTNKYT